MNAPDPIAESRARRHFQRGEAYIATGHDDAALAAYEAVIAEQPGHLAALLKLSALNLIKGRSKPAYAYTVRASQQHVQSPALALQLMGQLIALGQGSMVIEMCTQAPPAMWDSAQSLATVAQQLGRVGAHRMARTYAQAAVDRDPRHPPSLYMLAHFEVFFGEVDRAADLLERALSLHPQMVDAHWLLSRLRRPNAGVRIDRITRALERVNAGEDEAFLAYALHNELHEQREFAPAFAALERACRAKRASLAYDTAAMGQLFASLQNWKLTELSAGCSDRSLTPIFVIGLHRSGTTLIERILGGHSRISAAGETYDFPTQLRLSSGHYAAAATDARIVAMRSQLDYRSIGEGYLASMRWRARERPMVTDKLPSNFLNLGFIAQALPHARFVHVRRDPIDTGLSNLRTLFTNACPYSYDQAEFIQYHGWHAALMAHWRALLPDRILDVDYADVVADPLVAAQRLCAFCEIPFEPSMVEIERSSDPVATASSVLVRDGIRRDRGRLWSNYAQGLRPLIEAFTP